MSQNEIDMMSNMFSAFDVPSESCMAIAGNVEGSRFTVDVIMPKQHLMEIVTAFMQMQQQMMKMMTEDISGEMEGLDPEVQKEIQRQIEQMNNQ